MCRRLWFLLLCVGGLAACHDAGDRAPAAANAPAVAAPAAAPKRIALVMKTLSNPFFIEMEKGARQAGKEFGVNLEVRTSTQETATEEQIQIVDELIQSKADAIVIAPTDSQRLLPVLKQAQEAGVLIVNIDNQLDPAVMQSMHMRPVPFVSVDNEAAAYNSAKFVADQVSQPAQAAILEGIRGADNARLRTKGAERAFAANHAIHVVAEESANWKIDEAHTLTARLFAQHPDIRVIFCGNDMMALGALQYLHESGRKNVLVASYDALDEAKAAIRAGALAASVDQQAAQQGYLGVALAVKGLKGEQLPLRSTVDTRLVTAASLH